MSFPEWIKDKPDLVKALTIAWDALHYVECHYCRGTGNATHHRKVTGLCCFCEGVGVPREIVKAVRQIEEIGK